MSRCFPFPPPGYEKKSRTEDPGLLKKEKQREKKNKKEKKEKEKRESKEKKDKDRSDEKHKEKKDKKEKHLEKKEKDRDKDKVKSSNSDEKRFSGKSEGQDGEKTSNEKKFHGKSEGHNGEKFSQKEKKQKEKDKDRSSYSCDKKVTGKLSGYSGEKLGQNSYLAGDTKDSMFLQGLGRMVRDDDRATGNQLVEKFAVTERRRDKDMVRLVVEATVSLDEGKEKKDKRGDDRKLDEQGVRDEPRFCGNVMVRNLAGIVQTRVEGTPRSLEKDVESRTEGKEKTKQKEGNDKRGDIRKHKDREKNGQGEDKEKKKEKEKMKSEHKYIEKDKLKDSNKDDIIGMHNMKTLHFPKEGDKTASSEGNLRKRKESETNGFLHANDIKPNKLSRPTSSFYPLMDTNKVPRLTSSSIGTNKFPRPTSSSHPVMETNKVLRPTSSFHSLTGNGRILEICQTSALFTSDSQGAAGNLKADGKECKVNDIIISQPLSVSPVKPLFTQADQIAEASMKPPHPDTKYLSQILLIPRVEEWSDFDDQEWLYHSSDSQLKKPKSGSFMNDEMPHVWAEAMRIESADVCALPYVIPY